ncbi:MAG: hypothetical protein M9890_11240 [Thermomicrobiales bacterium]|nr:hypothetical protein [Thermomicrobiales bacterium]
MFGRSPTGVAGACADAPVTGRAGSCARHRDDTVAGRVVAALASVVVWGVGIVVTAQTVDL